MKHDLSRQTLGDLLRRTRQRFPNKLAIRCGDVDWTYAEFDDICDRLATGLAARGIEIGDRVAVISRNSHAFVALRFALARLGAVLVPINFMLSAERGKLHPSTLWCEGSVCRFWPRKTRPRSQQGYGRPRDGVAAWRGRNRPHPRFNDFPGIASRRRCHRIA